MTSVRKQQRQRSAAARMEANSKLTVQNKLDKAFMRGGSKREIKRLLKKLEDDAKA